LGGIPTLVDEEEKEEKEILKTVLQLLATSRHKLRSILAKLAQKKFEATESPDSSDNYMMKLSDNIIREMFVILIRLAYLTLLQESRKKQSQPKDKPADVRTLSICSPMAT
jgi:hypothetical protein